MLSVIPYRDVPFFYNKPLHPTKCNPWRVEEGNKKYNIMYNKDCLSSENIALLCLDMTYDYSKYFRI